MEAGFGAEEQATRRARKVERLRQEQAASDATGDAVADALARAERDKRNWAAGGLFLFMLLISFLGQVGAGIGKVMTPSVTPASTPAVIVPAPPPG